MALSGVEMFNLGLFSFQYLSSCDYVVFMREGQLIESGPHDDLMDKENGEYANFFKNITEQDLKSTIQFYILILIYCPYVNYDAAFTPSYGIHSLKQLLYDSLT